MLHCSFVGDLYGTMVDVSTINCTARCLCHITDCIVNLKSPHVYEFQYVPVYITTALL